MIGVNKCGKVYTKECEEKHWNMVCSSNTYPRLAFKNPIYRLWTLGRRKLGKGTFEFKASMVWFCIKLVGPKPAFPAGYLYNALKWVFNNSSQEYSYKCSVSEHLMERANCLQKIFAAIPHNSQPLTLWKLHEGLILLLLCKIFILLKSQLHEKESLEL